MTDSLRISPEQIQTSISHNVSAALAEDVGAGDITAQLIPESAQANARVISRENALICGKEWVNAVFATVDSHVDIAWQVADGDVVTPDQTLFTLSGAARSLLTGERCALNFLQTMSGTATLAHEYAQLVAGTGVRLLDTRKTLPGLRIEQKYAVSCGGCFNHRVGLYDAFLIKENHIAACGSIAAAIKKAHQVAPGKPVEIEVESFDELEQAFGSGADIIMLDNFTTLDMRKAVELNNGRAKLEASGGITRDTLREVAETGVDYISIGALTKDVRAVDLSMRITDIN